MSWKDFFKKKKPAEKNTYKKIEELGLKLHADDILQGRIAMIDYLHLAIEGGDIDLPSYISENSDDDNLQTIMEINKLAGSDDYNDQINAIYLQLKFMDRIIRTVAIPWLRAGDDRASAKCLRGWEGLFSLAKAIVSDVENIFSNADENALVSKVMDRSEIIFNLKIYLSVCTFKYGLYIVDISFRKEDVSPNQIALLMNMGNDQGYGGRPERKRDTTLFGNTGNNEELRKIIRDEIRRT